jgi:hypothetical protein
MSYSETPSVHLLCPRSYLFGSFLFVLTLVEIAQAPMPIQAMCPSKTAFPLRRKCQPSRRRRLYRRLIWRPSGTPCSRGSSRDRLLPSPAKLPRRTIPSSMQSPRCLILDKMGIQVKTQNRATRPWPSTFRLHSSPMRRSPMGTCIRIALTVRCR